MVEVGREVMVLAATLPCWARIGLQADAVRKAWRMRLGSPSSPPALSRTREREKGGSLSRVRERVGVRVCAALLLIIGTTASHALPTLDDVRAPHKPADITLTDRHGVPIQTLRVDHQARRLPQVPLADMSPALLQAVLLSEGKRLCEHSGVDWNAVAKSAWGNVLRGPSTSADTVATPACGVLQLQQSSCVGVNALAATSLARQGGMPLGEQLAPHFARQVIAADGAAVQRRTLDAGLRRVAVAALRRQLGELVGRNVEDGALVVLDNASGEVRA